MGNCVSNETKRTVTDTRRTVAQKTPVLLLYLPGPVRDAMLRCIQSDGTGSNAGSAVNVRFVDAQNQRNARRYWLKEISGRRDYAAIFYLADLRDHPTLLLTVRTLNWFLRTAYKTYDIRIIGVYDDAKQLDEFASCLPEGIEIWPLCEKEPQTIERYVALLQAIEAKFSDQRRTQTTTLPLR